MEKFLKKLRFCALGALYNGENAQYFEECLRSLESQTRAFPIYIVVDGFIRAELEDLLIKYQHLDISLIRRKRNQGLAKALQSGLNILVGKFDYVIRFDSDDVNRKDRFEVVERICVEFSPDLVSSHMFEVDQSGKVFSKRKVPTTFSGIKKAMPFRNPINHPASVFKLDSVLEVGGYKDMPFFEDWYLWLRMLKAQQFMLNINDYLVNFRATDQMVARRYGLGYIKNEAFFFRARGKEKLVAPHLNLYAFLLRFSIKLLGFSIYKKIFYLVRR